MQSGKTGKEQLRKKLMRELGKIDKVCHQCASKKNCDDCEIRRERKRILKQIHEIIWENKKVKNEKKYRFIGSRAIMNGMPGYFITQFEGDKELVTQFISDDAYGDWCAFLEYEGYEVEFVED